MSVYFFNCFKSSESKSHVIHLVHSATTKALKESVTERPTSVDPSSELTPDTSSLSSASSSQSSSSSLSSTPVPANTNTNSNVSQSFSQIQADLYNLYQQQQQQTSPDHHMTPKERFEQIHSEHLRYYESQGILAHQNAWYSSYIQQLALYKHM